jgi:hypothetical protein
VGHKTLVEGVRASLERQGFTYRTNVGRSLIEFEVTSPCKLLIVVEDLSEYRVGYLGGRIRREAALEIKRMVGSTTSTEELRKHALRFVTDLVESLPKEPWKGTGYIRSRWERSNWKKLSEI